MYRNLRAALLGTPSWAVMVGREAMRMQERVWWPPVQDYFDWKKGFTYDD